MKTAVAEKVSLDKNSGEKHSWDKNLAEKCNVAWFKLAEFVGRKEKERALGVYRLLSHSLSDPAFAAQLEGDLLMAFYDEKAVDAYMRAAWLYEEKGQFDHAAFLYEQITLFKPENREFLVQALKLYELIRNEVKIARCASQLARLLIKNGLLAALNDLMAVVSCSNEYRLYVEESCVIALIEFQPAQHDLIRDYLTHIIHAFEHDLLYKNRLTLFLARLSAVSEPWYQTAQALLKDAQ